MLRDSDIEAKQANVLANICMITAPDNKTIGKRAPEEYFGEIPASEKADIIARALIPSDPNLLTNYEMFVAERAGLLAAAATRLTAE